MTRILHQPPDVSTSHEEIARSLAEWERRLSEWNRNAGDASGDMRALYVCGAACAERIVRQLRADLRRAEAGS